MAKHIIMDIDDYGDTEGDLLCIENADEEERDSRMIFLSLEASEELLSKLPSMIDELKKRKGYMNDKEVGLIPAEICVGEPGHYWLDHTEVDPTWVYHVYVTQELIDEYNQVVYAYKRMMLKLKELKEIAKEPLNYKTGGEECR